MKTNHLKNVKALALAITGKDPFPEIKLSANKTRKYVRIKEKNDMAEKAFEEKVIWYLRGKDCIVHKNGEMANYNCRYVLPGFPDLTVIVCNKKIIAFVECKTLTGRISNSQKEFRKICMTMGIPHVFCRKLEDLKEIL